MLANDDSSLRYVASSSERMRLIELFELQHEEGPCLDAYRTGIAVHSVLHGDAHEALAAASRRTHRRSGSHRCPRSRCDFGAM